MVLPNDIRDLEWQKFVELTGGTAIPVVRVIDLVNNSLIPAPWDYMLLSQNATQDIYTFKTGGVGGTLLSTVTVTFVDATKATIQTVVKT